MMSRLLVTIFCFTGWAVAMMESISRRESSSRETAKPGALPSPLTEHPPVTSRISLGSPALSVHSATAVEMPDGTIRAYWFGGSREGASDVAIWTSDFIGGTWSVPRVAVNRDLVAQRTRRYIRKLGNPVAHVDENGEVTLFVVSVSFGGWSGSAINRLVFAPDGKRLVSVNRLVASPLLNLGTLVRGAAVSEGSGQVLLPAYHEMVKKFPLLLRIAPDGRVVTRGGPTVRGHLFQPWMINGEGDRAEIFLRRGEGKEAKVFFSRREGDEWSAPVTIPVLNPNSGISAVRLADGGVLLAANPESDSRSRLVLLRADDPAGPWETVFTVDTEVREEDERAFKHLEYSYPWLMADRKGVVHLYYTWNRREIRHLSIGQERLVKGSGGAP